MKPLLKPSGLPPVSLRLFIIVLLAIGIFFRFANIDRKIYWHDEAFTSLRISGYTIAEMVRDVIDKREVDIKYLQKYQNLKPESRLIDTLNSLAIEDPQHPPFYYVIARLWLQWLGNSVGAIRSLTACISLLLFPCVYWLCLELFASHLVGWVAVGLFAVSPVHVLFAQEAREYCLWTVTILLSSAALLRGLRLNNLISWGIYAITLALSLYTFLLSGVVAVGHAIYVVFYERLRLTRRAIAYLLASLTGVLIFIPWLVTTLLNFSMLQATTGWTSLTVPNSILIQKWILHISRIFFDLDIDVNRGFTTYLPMFAVIIFIVLYSFYFICRTSPQRVWLFIFTLFGTTALFLIVPDLIKGGQRSIVPRYLFPCYLAIQLAVAYLLATKITSTSFWQQKWQLIMVMLLSGGVISCLVSSQAQTWWIKDISYNNPQIANLINQTTHPLLIGYAGCSNNGNLISLSYLLQPKVRLQFVVEPNLPQLSDRKSDVFLFGECSERSRARLENERGYKLEPILQSFWQIKNWQNRKEE